MIVTLLITLAALVPCIFAAHPDEITELLPGLIFPLNYRHYSGYLNATRGRFLHYWFVESQNDPANDPVVLWLNGGPGCSSLEGFLGELGPLHVTSDGKSLYNNPYSWNRIANVIFVESPAGVGFSYADDKKYDTDDDTASYDNYVALQHFFEKFPQFAKNDFYITGESYAGIYIPTLSVRIFADPGKINFKGLAIGNGYLDGGNLTNSMIFFAYYHGLIGNELWSSLSQHCCGGQASLRTCNFASGVTSDCHADIYKVLEVIIGSGLNLYNLYSDCEHSTDKTSRYSVDRRTVLRYWPEPRNEFTMSDDQPCTDSSNLRYYLNQPSVREALHIPAQVQSWELCSLAVEKTYKHIYPTMRPQILQLIGGGLRVLVYNGDVDMACNFVGDELFTYGLGLNVTKEYKPWKLNRQVAGFYKVYGNLTFLTIKGSGHMVPQDKPGPAFKMIDSFLNNKPYD